MERLSVCSVLYQLKIQSIRRKPPKHSFFDPGKLQCVLKHKGHKLCLQTDPSVEGGRVEELPPQPKFLPFEKRKRGESVTYLPTMRVTFLVNGVFYGGIRE